MNLTEWRTAVKEQAGRLRSRLSDLVRQTERPAPGVIYGATAALAVAPLVAAVQSGGVPYVELAALLGGAGVNILSTELYNWHQRSEKEIAAELPTHLGELAVANSDWRDLLDKLIQSAQADSAVQAALGEAAVPYLAALSKDVQRLDSRIIVANVGDNARYMNIGDYNSITVTENHFHGAQPPITFDDILRSYLAKERRICDELTVAKPKADSQRVPRMQQVFVEMRTTLPVDETIWFDRLGVMEENQREKVRQQFRRQADDGAERSPRRQSSKRAADKNRPWYAELHRLDDEKLAPVAKILGVTPAQIRSARHPLTPLEHLRTRRLQGQPPHLVLLGDPGFGKSTWVRRLTSVLAWQWLTEHGETLEPLTEAERVWLDAAQRGQANSRRPFALPCTAGPAWRAAAS